MLANEKDRQSVANEVSTVHHLVEWGRNTISLALRDDRNHAKARENSALCSDYSKPGTATTKTRMIPANWLTVHKNRRHGMSSAEKSAVC